MRDKKATSILSTLRTSLSLLDNKSLFGDDLSNIESCCCNYLKYLGYKVAKRPEYNNITKIDDLVTYFYSLMEYHHNEVCSLVANRSKDLKVISSFVKQRMLELNYSRKAAMNDCALIMTTIFNNEVELGLDRPVGVWVFGTKKCKWITDKAITLLNNNYERFNEEIVYLEAIKFDKKASKDCEDYDLDKILKRFIHD